MEKTYTKFEIASNLVRLWYNKRIKLEWIEFEDSLIMIHHSELNHEQRNQATMEALDAFTKRGHFDPKNYFTQE